eukprot:COSAG02_NODE_32684_length_512_cov_0.975787_1_plen_51_part_01
MMATAEALALTEYDARTAIDMVLGSRWDALTRDFWWRGVMKSGDLFLNGGR